MSKFFKALEQAEWECVLREQARRQPANPTVLGPPGPAALRADPCPNGRPVKVEPSSARPPIYRIQEMKAEEGILVAVATAEDGGNGARIDLVIPIPPALHWLQPLLVALPLQLLAYHLGVLRGNGADRLRTQPERARGE